MNRMGFLGRMTARLALVAAAGAAVLPLAACTSTGGVSATDSATASVTDSAAANGQTSADGSAASDASATSSASGSADAADTPGTGFRQAPALTPGRQARANAATGDYLYWSFTAKAGQTDTVRATVQLPPSAQRHGTADWRLDLYDGLRRRQTCVKGHPERAAANSTEAVTVSCTLPRVRTWADTWSVDPLPGTYYARLTVGSLVERDLGLPVTVQIELASQDGPVQPAGASAVVPLSLPTTGPTTGATTGASDGASAAPSAGATADPVPTDVKARAESFFTGRHARWWWTGIGAGLGALLGVAGYCLTRRPLRRRRPYPPGYPDYPGEYPGER